MGVSRSLLFICCFTVAFCLQAQEHVYFLSFDKKTQTEDPHSFLTDRSLLRRQSHAIKIDHHDYPVDKELVSRVLDSQTSLLFTSKWLNGILIKSVNARTFERKKYPFVKDVQYLGILNKGNTASSSLAQINKTEELSYGNSLEQVQSLGVDKMHLAGFNGKGRYIAVLDGGFTNANTLASLQHLYDSQRVKFVYNVVKRNAQVYQSHIHGTNVLSCLAAYSPSNLIGTGYGADFALIVTEDVERERLMEEYFWLRGAEIADSLGVDIISSSLGYNTFEDDPANSHTQDQLDGETAIITQAAEMAARKGILVIVSAGNNYMTSWPKIVFPADGDSVLAVGAVDNSGNKASFSAVGPTADGRTKPDVCALGTGVVVNSDGDNYARVSGTSYSTPLVTGLAAGLWQMDTTLSNIELKNYLVQSASIYCTPNNQIGYGIPNFELAYELITNRKYRECSPNSIDYAFFPNPVEGSVVFREGELALQGKEYAILDVNGKVLLQGMVGTPSYLKIKIDISGLKAGVYFIRIGEKLFRLLKT